MQAACYSTGRTVEPARPHDVPTYMVQPLKRQMEGRVRPFRRCLEDAVGEFRATRRHCSRYSQLLRPGRGAWVGCRPWQSCFSLQGPHLLYQAIASESSRKSEQTSLGSVLIYARLFEAMPL